MPNKTELPVTINYSRRRFLRRGCAAVALSGLAGSTAWAGNDKIPEDDPTALALGYKHDAAAVDTAKFPKRADAAGQTQFCDNCALYVTADGDAEWAPCSIFQNRLVAAKGWCNAWVPKA